MGFHCHPHWTEKAVESQVVDTQNHLHLKLDTTNLGRNFKIQTIHHPPLSRFLSVSNRKETQTPEGDRKPEKTLQARAGERCIC